MSLLLNLVNIINNLITIKVKAKNKPQSWSEKWNWPDWDGKLKINVDWGFKINFNL